MNMGFGANKTSTELIKEDTFGKTYFRDIYAGVNGKWYKNHGWVKECDQKYYCSNYYVNANKYGLKCETSLRFWENKGWIDNSIDPYGWFQWYFRYWLGRQSSDDKRMARWKGIVSRFNGKLIKMIKNVNGRFDYSISPKIRQILLHWGHELVESDLLWFFFVVVQIKMRYYWFNRKMLLQKAKNKYHNCGGKEEAAKYYIAHKDVLKKMQE